MTATGKDIANAPEVKLLLDRIDRLQRENASLRSAQTYTYIGRDGKSVLARDLEDRAEAAEAEVKRLRDLVWRAREISRPSIYPTWHKDANAALASTGGEHHAE